MQINVELFGYLRKNVFSMLAKGDVALSVTLTACSSLITLFTLPLIMAWVTK